MNKAKCRVGKIHSLCEFVHGDFINTVLVSLLRNYSYRPIC